MARDFDKSKIKILRHVGDIESNGKEIRVQIIQYEKKEPSITLTRIFERSNGEVGYAAISGIKVDEMSELLPLMEESLNDLRENFNKYNAGEKSKKETFS